MINCTPQVSLSERSEAFPKGVSIVEGGVNNNVAVFVDVSGLELLSTSPFSNEYGKQCTFGWHRPEVSTRVIGWRDRALALMCPHNCRVLTNDEHFPDVISGEEELDAGEVAEEGFDVAVVEDALQVEAVANGGVDCAGGASAGFAL